MSQSSTAVREPLLRIAKRAALEQLLTAAETATPW